MGSISAMASIERVIEDHDVELIAEYVDQVPEGIRHLISGAELEGDIYHIKVWWKIRSFQGGGEERLEGPVIDIDTLAARFPCCSVGY